MCHPCLGHRSCIGLLTKKGTFHPSRGDQKTALTALTACTASCGFYNPSGVVVD